MSPRSVPTRSRKRSPPTTRRALELLAASQDGCSEAIMLAHGCTVDMLVKLIRAGLATAGTERMVADGRSIEVSRCGSRTPAGARWRDAPSNPAPRSMTRPPTEAALDHMTQLIRSIGYKGRFR
jgi:hypothetical protein